MKELSIVFINHDLIYYLYIFEFSLTVVGCLFKYVIRSWMILFVVILCRRVERCADILGVG